MSIGLIVGVCYESLVYIGLMYSQEVGLCEVSMAKQKWQVSYVSHNMMT